MSTPTPATMSLPEACAYLGVTDYALRRLIKQKRVAVINTSGSAKNPRYRFRQVDLDAFLERAASASLQGELPEEPPVPRQRLTPARNTGIRPVRL
jgi:excisionase family DNA binding protein